MGSLAGASFQYLWMHASSVLNCVYNYPEHCVHIELNFCHLESSFLGYFVVVIRNLAGRVLLAYPPWNSNTIGCTSQSVLYEVVTPVCTSSFSVDSGE